MIYEENSKFGLYIVLESIKCHPTLNVLAKLERLDSDYTAPYEV